MDDIKNALADIVGGTVETMMQAELEDELGYAKYDVDNKNTENSRNGSSSKTVRSDYGEIEIEVPRNRKGQYALMSVIKDLKLYTADMKNIHKAATEELGLMELDKIEEIWGKKYPAAIGKACLAN